MEIFIKDRCFEFELFLKFKKFLKFERDQQEGKVVGHPWCRCQQAADLPTSDASAQPDQPSELAQDGKGGSFMTLPNGKVLEVINVGVF